MREWMLPLICSAIIVVVQIVFAPILAIFSVVPSFIVAFILVLTILRRPDSTYVYAFVLGLISGYPMGAKIVTDLRTNNNCTKDEGERMLCFTNNSGPLFIIGTVRNFYVFQF